MSSVQMSGGISFSSQIGFVSFSFHLGLQILNKIYQEILWFKKLIFQNYISVYLLKTPHEIWKMKFFSLNIFLRKFFIRRTNFLNVEKIISQIFEHFEHLSDIFVILIQKFKHEIHLDF